MYYAYGWHLAIPVGGTIYWQLIVLDFTNFEKSDNSLRGDILPVLGRINIVSIYYEFVLWHQIARLWRHRHLHIMTLKKKTTHVCQQNTPPLILFHWLKYECRLFAHTFDVHIPFIRISDTTTHSKDNQIFYPLCTQYYMHKCNVTS